MFHLLLVLSGVYLGGLIVAFFQTFVASDAIDRAFAKNAILTIIWPVSLITLMAMGRKSVREALGITTLARREEIFAQMTELADEQQRRVKILIEEKMRANDLLLRVSSAASNCDECSMEIGRILYDELANSLPPIDPPITWESLKWVPPVHDSEATHSDGNPPLDVRPCEQVDSESHAPREEVQQGSRR